MPFTEGRVLLKLITTITEPLHHPLCGAAACSKDFESKENSPFTMTFSSLVFKFTALAPSCAVNGALISWVQMVLFLKCLVVIR